MPPLVEASEWPLAAQLVEHTSALAATKEQHSCQLQLCKHGESDITEQHGALQTWPTDTKACLGAAAALWSR